MSERGISPIIATILLIAITVVAAMPVAYYLAGYYVPFRPRRTDIVVYAGLIDENIVRFHIQHIGGESIKLYDPTRPEPTTAVITGWASDPTHAVDNTFYCWTFENPMKFRQSDWAYAEVQLHGAELAAKKTIKVKIARLGAGLLYDGEVTINAMDQVPGG